MNFRGGLNKIMFRLHDMTQAIPCRRPTNLKRTAVTVKCILRRNTSKPRSWVRVQVLYCLILTQLVHWKNVNLSLCLRATPWRCVWETRPCSRHVTRWCWLVSFTHWFLYLLYHWIGSCGWGWGGMLCVVVAARRKNPSRCEESSLSYSV